MGIDKLLIILVIFLVISIVVMLTFFISRLVSYNNAFKRIKPFSVDCKSNEVTSLADTIVNAFINVIVYVSKFIKKFNFFNNYAKRFDKYLTYIGHNIEGYIFITYKFLVMLLMQIVFIVMNVLKRLPFRFDVFFIISVVSFFIIDIVIYILYRNKRKLLEEQLLQAVVIMNSAFKSGKNIYQALCIVKDELPAPIREEFNLIYKDINYGLCVEKAFERFYDRVKIEEAKYISSSLTLLTKTGGSIVTVFNMIENNFYNRLKIKNELNSLISQSKFLYKLLIILPIAFIGVIYVLDPLYFIPLLSNPIGILIIIFSMLLYILYIVIISKIMKVEQV